MTICMSVNLSVKTYVSLLLKTRGEKEEEKMKKKRKDKKERRRLYFAPSSAVASAPDGKLFTHTNKKTRQTRQTPRKLMASGWCRL